MKGPNLQSLERMEWMMVRWIYRVLLKDRKRMQCGFVVQSCLLNVQSVADVVRQGRLIWCGHLEHRSVDDWVLG